MSVIDDLNAGIVKASKQGDKKTAQLLYSELQKQSAPKDAGQSGAVNLLHQFTRGVASNVPYGEAGVDALNPNYQGDTTSIPAQGAHTAGQVAGFVPMAAYGTERVIARGLTDLGSTVVGHSPQLSRMISDVWSKVGPYAEGAGAAVRQGVNAAGDAIYDYSKTAANRLGQARDVGAKFFSDIADRLMTKPSTLITDASAGAGAGAAGAAAKKQGASEPLVVAAQLAGGGVGGGLAATAKVLVEKAIPNSFKFYMENAPGPLVAKLVKAVRTGEVSLPKATPPAAVHRLATVASNPSLAAKNIETADMVPGALPYMSPATLAQDRGLLLLERTVLRDVESLSLKQQNDHEQVLTAIRNATSNLETSGNTVATARAHLSDLLDTQVQVAGQKLEQAVAQMGTNGATNEDLSALTTKLLEGAKRQARKQESDLYKKADLSQEATADVTGAIWKDYLVNKSENVAKDVLDKLPRGVEQLLGRLAGPPPPPPLMVAGKQLKQAVIPTGPLVFKPGPMLANGTDVGNLVRLRSALLETVRDEQKQLAPDNRLISLSEELANGILGDLEKVPGNEHLKLARGFSADLNDKFSRGTVGQILGSRATGGARIDPQLTLSRTVAQPGEEGGASVKDMLNALNNTEDLPKAREYITSYLSNNFLAQAKDTNGEFNLTKAENFLAANRNVLKHFPELQRQIGHAIALKDSSVLAMQAADPKKSLVALITKHDYAGTEMSNLMSSANAPTAVKGIMALLPPDGQMGMRRGFFDWLMDQDGKDLAKQLANPKVIATMGELGITKEQLIGISQLKNTVSAMQLQASVKSGLKDMMGGSATLTGQLRHAGQRIIGAKFFSMANKLLPAEARGGGFVVAEQGANLMQNLAGVVGDPARLWIKAAMEDPQLLKAGLTSVDKQASTIAKEMANKKLRSWLSSQPFMIPIAGKYAQSQVDTAVGPEHRDQK